MRSFPPRLMPKLKEEIPGWLDRWDYDRFVTLATNKNSPAGDRLFKPSIGPDRLRERLRKWDAHMNGKLLGRDWAKRVPDHTWAFYFLEKVDTNPHWHGLVRFVPVMGMTIEEQGDIFDEWAKPIWSRLVPSGTVDVQDITDQRPVTEYVAKQLGHPISYEHFIVPDALVRG